MTEDLEFPLRPDDYTALFALEGIAKDVFEQLGGGEAFIRQERASFERQQSINDGANEIPPSR